MQPGDMSSTGTAEMSLLGFLFRNRYSLLNFYSEERRDALDRFARRIGRISDQTTACFKHVRADIWELIQSRFQSTRIFECGQGSV